MMVQVQIWFSFSAVYACVSFNFGFMLFNNSGNSQAFSFLTLPGGCFHLGPDKFTSQSGFSMNTWKYEFES